MKIKMIGFFKAAPKKVFHISQISVYDFFTLHFCKPEYDSGSSGTCPYASARLMIICAVSGSDVPLFMLVFCI